MADNWKDIVEDVLDEHGLSVGDEIPCDLFLEIIAELIEKTGMSFDAVCKRLGVKKSRTDTLMQLLDAAAMQSKNGFETVYDALQLPDDYYTLLKDLVIYCSEKFFFGYDYMVNTLDVAGYADQSDLLPDVISTLMQKHNMDFADVAGKLSLYKYYPDLYERTINFTGPKKVIRAAAVDYTEMSGDIVRDLDY
jgi:hypothetical protein